jgi:hypothetical protein
MPIPLEHSFTALAMIDELQIIHADIPLTIDVKIRFVARLWSISTRFSAKVTRL